MLAKQVKYKNQKYRHYASLRSHPETAWKTFLPITGIKDISLNINGIIQTTRKWILF